MDLRIPISISSQHSRYNGFYEGGFERTLTSSGEHVSRGRIQRPSRLKELWFNTGTLCNLSCPFCFENSTPTNDRLVYLTLDDIQKTVDEAQEYWGGEKSFAVTGGEPMLNPEIVDISKYLLKRGKLLILTNGAYNLKSKQGRKLQNILTSDYLHRLSFRMSIDGEEKEHNNGRGKGTFRRTIANILQLQEDTRISQISVAGIYNPRNETHSNAESRYENILENEGIELKRVPLVLFPQFDPDYEIPAITTSCLQNDNFFNNAQNAMCSKGVRMVAKQKGSTIRYFDCTLVSDLLDMASETLSESLNAKREQVLGHHRCYSCITSGDVSCSG